MRVLTSCLVLLCTASPLLAAMDTFKNLLNFTAGTVKVKYGSSTDPITSGNSKIYFELSGAASLATAPPAAFCIAIGVAGQNSKVTDWSGADVGLYSFTYDSTTTPPAFTLATGFPLDITCAVPTVTTSPGFCSTVGVAATGTPEAGQNWKFVSGTAITDQIAYSSGTLKLEISRPNTASNPTVDLWYTPPSSKMLLAYWPTACPVIDGQLAGTDVGIVDPLAPNNATSLLLFNSFSQILRVSSLLCLLLLFGLK